MHEYIKLYLYILNFIFIIHLEIIFYYEIMLCLFNQAMIFIYLL